MSAGMAAANARFRRTSPWRIATPDAPYQPSRPPVYPGPPATTPAITPPATPTTRSRGSQYDDPVWQEAHRRLICDTYRELFAEREAVRVEDVAARRNVSPRTIGTWLSKLGWRWPPPCAD
jgi:hypothetical protein